MGYWKFEETSGTLYDSSGNGKNGISYGGITYGVSGKVGSALGFDGIDDYINAGSVGDFSSTDSFSTSFWFKKTGTFGNYERFLSTSDGSSPYFGWHMQVADDGANKRFNLSSGFFAKNRNDINANTYCDGNWHHVVMTFVGHGGSASADVNFYLDGLGPGTYTNLNPNCYPRMPSNHPLLIGTRELENAWFNGTMDEVAIYNRVLSASEILDIYDNQK